MDSNQLLSVNAHSGRALLSADNDECELVGFYLMPVMFILGIVIGALATWFLMRRQLSKQQREPDWHRNSSDDILVSKSIAIDLDTNMPIGLGVYDYSLPQPQTNTLTLALTDGTGGTSASASCCDDTTRGSQGKPRADAGSAAVGATPCTRQGSQDSNDHEISMLGIELMTSHSFHTPPGSPSKAALSSKAGSSSKHTTHTTNSLTTPQPTALPYHLPAVLVTTAELLEEERPSLEVSLGSNLVLHTAPRTFPNFSKGSNVSNGSNVSFKGWASTVSSSMSKADAARAALVAPYKLARCRTTEVAGSGPHSTGAPSRGVTEHYLGKSPAARSATMKDEYMNTAE